MNITPKKALIGYGIFCVATLAVGFLYSRHAKPGDPIAAFNSSLLRLNVLMLVVPQ